jgi:hypothetical protein
MSQPLNWWRDYYAGLIYQGVLSELSLDDIKAELDNLITEAKKAGD